MHSMTNTELQTGTGTLAVMIASHHQDSLRIPKQIQVLGADMIEKKASWMSGSNWSDQFPSGLYIVRLHLSSGKQQEEIVHIYADKTTTVNFQLQEFSPFETQEWMYFTKSNSGDNPNAPTTQGSRKTRSIRKKATLNDINGFLWHLQQNTWQRTAAPNFANRTINEFGENFEMNLPDGLHLLEVQNYGSPSIFVAVPPGNGIKCLVKTSEGPEKAVPELDISISTKDERAQALLSLMCSGDMNRAKTLQTAQEAENLLYGKAQDPPAAAIGGYYLLKIGKLELLHDWANNLANWFAWMPDGSIIHAWQIIQGAGENNQALDIGMIRKRFLDAVNRGIPIYTEGLRLLYEGLSMLSFDLTDDQQVQRALKRVKKYLTYADMSQETTTFTGIYPDQPGSDIDTDDRMVSRSHEPIQ